MPVPAKGCFADDAGTWLDDGPTRVVPTVPVAGVKGAPTCDPGGKLLGGCGIWFGGPAPIVCAVDTGGSCDNPAHPPSITTGSKTSVSLYNLNSFKSRFSRMPQVFAGCDARRNGG